MLWGEHPFPWTKSFRPIGAVFLLLCLHPAAAAAAELEQGRKLFVSGDYAGCTRLCEEAVRDRQRDEEWPLLWMKSLLATGHYPEAQRSEEHTSELQSHSFIS